jgi:hypothetical protein
MDEIWLVNKFTFEQVNWKHFILLLSGRANEMQLLLTHCRSIYNIKTLL